VSPFLGMTLLGLGYSLLASALWPMVSLIVPTQRLGTAYGFMQAIQNLGLAVVSIVAGAIVDSKVCRICSDSLLGARACVCVCVFLSVCVCVCVCCLHGTQQQHVFWTAPLTQAQGYLWLEMFFSACMSFTLMVSVLLLFIDAGSGGSLNLTARER
jgi:MFS family permease